MHESLGHSTQKCVKKQTAKRILKSVNKKEIHKLFTKTSRQGSANIGVYSLIVSKTKALTKTNKF